MGCNHFMSTLLTWGITRLVVCTLFACFVFGFEVQTQSQYLRPTMEFSVYPKFREWYQSIDHHISQSWVAIMYHPSCSTSSGRISVIFKSHSPVGRKKMASKAGQEWFPPTKFNPKKCAELNNFTIWFQYLIDGNSLEFRFFREFDPDAVCCWGTT